MRQNLAWFNPLGEKLAPIYNPSRHLEDGPPYRICPTQLFPFVPAGDNSGNVADFCISCIFSGLGNLANHKAARRITLVDCHVEWVGKLAYDEQNICPHAAMVWGLPPVRTLSATHRLPLYPDDAGFGPTVLVWQGRWLERKDLFSPAINGLPEYFCASSHLHSHNQLIFNQFFFSFDLTRFDITF